MKIGIIGSGFGIYGLLPAFATIKDCEVVSVCGKNTDRLLKACASSGVKHVYSDWKDMLTKEKIDALVLAVVPSAQYDIAIVAIKKGIHIFAEKPLAANLKQAKTLLDLSKKHNVITAVDFTFSEIDEFAYVKKSIDTKEFGELRHISLSWNFLSYDIKNNVASWKTNVDNGGGAVSFFFSHCIYYLQQFAGEIKKSTSTIYFSEKSLLGGETGGDFLIHFKNGVLCNAHIDCNSPGINEHRITFIFDEATIVLENNKDAMKSFEVKTYTYKDKKNILKVKQFNVHKVKEGEDERVFYVRKIATRFIESCIKKEEMNPNFKDGYVVQNIIEKIRNVTKTTSKAL